MKGRVMVRFSIITLFPEFFQGPTSVGQVGRAIQASLLSVDLIHLRDFAPDRYGTVDDKVYGGGAGMVLQCQPLVRALEFIQAQKSAREAATGVPEQLKVIALSAAGRLWEQAWIEREAQDFNAMSQGGGCRHYVLVCGRYEGLDQRFIEAYCDAEISIGDYVLNGGEGAAWIVMESLARFVDGVVGKEESRRMDSFSVHPEAGERLLDCPHYTTPAQFRGLEIPAVLLSGHHRQISEWRLKQSCLRTEKRKPNARLD